MKLKNVTSGRQITIWYKLVLLLMITVFPLFISGCPDNDDSARIHKEFPIESEQDLSPPIIDSPVYVCTRAVKVTGFAPGALVRVHSNVNGVVGEAVPHFGFAEIQLNQPLEINESITATQTVDGVTSAHSHQPVIVGPLPDFPDGVPPRPVITSDLYECGRVVPVGGLIPGVKVLVKENGGQVGSANAAGTWKGVFTSSLNDGGAVTAVQATCVDVPENEPLESQPSPEKIVKPMPDPFNKPVMDESTVVVGNDSVTLRELYAGSKVTVYDRGNDIASGYSNNDVNWVPLPDPIDPAWRLSSDQALCDRSDPTDPIEPKDRLPAPVIIGPVCDDDEYIRVLGTIVNATVVLLKNGNVAGLAGAVPGELRLPVGTELAKDDIITVHQYMGETISPPSNEITVCACSEKWLEERIDEILSNAPDDLKPVQCNNSSVKLFQNNDPFSVIEVTLRADFDTINHEPVKDNAKSTGILTYIDPTTGQPVSINCTVSARGNSRFSYCEWRPLKLRFDSNPDDTILDGTGKMIKIVTHCEWLNGAIAALSVEPGTIEEDRRHLFQEFALYEILGTMGTTALETRLAHITYEEQGGNILKTEYAFFREREKRAAERCGFERLEADEGDAFNVFPSDPGSLFQVEFHHKFLFSHDYSPQSEHNVIRMKSPDGKEYYIPYDFDLTGIIHPTYWKHSDWTIEQNGGLMIAWLEAHNNQALAQIQVANLLQYEDEMRTRVENGLVDHPGKARLMRWFEDHIKRLKCFLN